MPGLIAFADTAESLWSLPPLATAGLHLSPTADPKMNEKIDLPPKVIEYLNAARAPLPPFTDPDEELRIDSLGVIRFVAFLETDLGIRLEDEELVGENFATLRRVSELLKPKLRKVPGGASSGG